MNVAVPPAFRPELDNLAYWVQRALHGTSEERRAITKNEPLIFALVYFSHHLRSADTGWQISLNQMHIDMCEEATQWRYHWGPAEYRVAWVGPRDVGKSTWNFVILPAWALAHKWRQCIVMFSDGNEQAEKHFSNLKREFADNKLLRLDFPELCTPGPEKIDNVHEYIAASGVSISARGISAKVLGFKERNRRPDMLVIDDIEPTGSEYSMVTKRKRLEKLTEKVFFLNLNAVVVIVGTVTRYGAIMHEIVQAACARNSDQVAPWIREENIDCRYYPAIVTDANGREYSFWPQRWDYDRYMKRRRNNRVFQLQMMNMPTSAMKGWWDPETDFHYNFPYLVETQVLAIDPAVKSQEINDETGLALIGFDAPKYHALVQYAEGVRLDPNRLRERVAWIISGAKLLTHVIIEDNNGGDYVTNTLAPVIPRHIQVVSKFEGKDRQKILRLRELHDYHQMRWVFHAPGLNALEEQEKAFPDVDHDDIVDAVAKGCHFHLQHRPMPAAA